MLDKDLTRSTDMTGTLELAAVARLDETQVLTVRTYEEQINAYQGSEESKNLAYTFCREFEPSLIALGFEFKPTLLGIDQVVWLCSDVNKVQDAIELFIKGGITFTPSEEDNSVYEYCMKASMHLPRFGGQVTICAMAFSYGVAGVAVKFPFYGR